MTGYRAMSPRDDPEIEKYIREQKVQKWGAGEVWDWEWEEQALSKLKLPLSHLQYDFSREQG